MKKTTVMRAGLVLVALGLAGTAVAGPKDRQEKREERRDDRHDKREEKRDDRQDKREERRDDRQDKREEKVDDLKDEWKKKHSDWVEKRQERRQARREELKKLWGDLVDKPVVRAELRVHGRRLARLNRVRFLAEANGKTAAVERADKAIKRENERHQKRMDALKAKGGAE